MQKTLFGGSIQSNRSFLPKYQSRVCRLGVNEILALCMHNAFANRFLQNCPSNDDIGISDIQQFEAFTRYSNVPKYNLMTLYFTYPVTFFAAKA